MRSAAIVQRAQSPGHQIHQPHEVRHHAVRRMGIDLERRAVLLHPAGVHHRHLVGERERLGLVVRDVDEGDAGAALQLLQLDPHALAQLGVEIGQRLVEQQDRRLDDQRAGERDALLLAAGQLVRIAAFEPAQIDQRKRLLDLLLAPPRSGPCAASARTRRSGTRSCAARPRSSGTPCPCRALPAARRPWRTTPPGRRLRSFPCRARCSRRSAAASWSCRSPTAPAA